MNRIKNLELDMEIAWYWAMSKYQQSIRNSHSTQKETLIVNRQAGNGLVEVI